jgi:hypothetical protein
MVAVQLKVNYIGVHTAQAMFMQQEGQLVHVPCLRGILHVLKDHKGMWFQLETSDPMDETRRARVRFTADLVHFITHIDAVSHVGMPFQRR